MRDCNVHKNRLFLITFIMTLFLCVDFSQALPVVSTGTTFGTINVTLTPTDPANTLLYKINTKILKPTPVPGSLAPGGSLPFTSGVDLTGVDPKTKRFVQFYEMNASNKVTTFCQITVLSSDIKAFYINNISTTPGNVAGTTRLIISPNIKGDKIQIVVNNTSTTHPNCVALPTTIPYKSNTNIANVDASTNKYISVYELWAKGIYAYREITLTGLDIAAPLISSFSCSKGTTPGSTKITVTPNTGGDTFVYRLTTTTPSALPGIGSSLPSNTTPYSSGNDIIIPAPATTKFIELFEINGSSKITAFQQIPLLAANITAPQVSSAIVTCGSIAGTTKLVLTPFSRGGKFKIQIASAPTAVPSYGSTAIGTAYRSKTNIAGVDATLNKYIDVYEYGSKGLMAFTEVTVTASAIAALTIITVTASPGSIQGSTKITLTANTPGENFYQLVSSTKALSLARSGDAVPADASPYASGADLLNVSVLTNKYINIYEVDVSNKITAYRELLLTSGKITAPTISSISVSTGSLNCSSKLTLTPSATSNTFKIRVSSSSSTFPAVGGSLIGTTYRAGTMITGVDITTNKYLDVYEVNSKGIVAYTQIILTNSTVSAPPTTTPTILGGSVPESTKIILTLLSPSNSFAYVVTSTAITEFPGTNVNLPAGTTPYISGNDITGVDQSTNKYINLYEIDATNKIVAFRRISLSATRISTPLLIDYAVEAGLTSGSTKLTLTPNNAGNTFRVNIVSTPITTLPVIYGTPLGTTYVSGRDLVGADSTTNKYVDIYEICSIGNVSFREITLSAGDITAPTIPNAASSPGAIAGSTKIIVTPTNLANTLQYVVSDTALSPLPITRNSLPPGTNSYSSGNSIVNVDSITNKYVDLYEIDGSSQIIAFREFLITNSKITAPDILDVTVAPGSAANTTSLIISPNEVSDTFKVSVTSIATTLPVIGASPSGSVYICGNNISNVDVTSNKYINVSELGSNGKIIAFKRITLSNDDISAPLITSLSTTTGTVASSTKIIVTPNIPGDTFECLISSTPITTLPAVGDALPGTTSVYTANSNLLGVDPTTNKYVRLYEVDGLGSIVAFNQITLSASEISAQNISSVTVAPGTIQGSTKIALTPNTPGDTFLVNIVNSQVPIPAIGTAGVGNTYLSNTNIPNINTSKYIDVYEVDILGNVVAFKEISLFVSNICAPLINSITVTPGSISGATKLTVTPNIPGDTIRYTISNTPATLPTLGDLSIGTDYTLNSDILGADPVTNKYLAVCEIDGSYCVVAFKEFIIQAGDILP